MGFVRNLSEQLLPPLLTKVGSKFCRCAVKKSKTKEVYGWSGDYATWAEAVTNTTGYEVESILSKALDAELRVRRGDAAFERDTVCFDRPDHSWPTLAALMYCAAISSGRLRVVDFGGGLGSTWSKYRDILANLPEVRWGVVELPAYVKVGKDQLQNIQLSFHADIADAISSVGNHILFSSSVLQYLEKPYEFLQEASAYGFEFICLDRIGCTLDERDRLTVQYVSPHIYDASYPCWFLSEQKIKAKLLDRYDCLLQFEASDHANIPSAFRGFLFRRRVLNEGHK